VKHVSWEDASDRADRDQTPVKHVSWEDAMVFCAKLRKRTGRYYTLPDEAQWEYACRAGTTTAFHCGATLISEFANFNAVPYYIAGNKTSAVDQFPANRWGLLDLHGNVSEWCLDEWKSSYGPAPEDFERRDIRIPAPEELEGLWRGDWMPRSVGKVEKVVGILRGGDLHSKSTKCRSAYRDVMYTGDTLYNIGFRVCCLPQEASSSNRSLRSAWLAVRSTVAKRRRWPWINTDSSTTMWYQVMGTNRSRIQANRAGREQRPVVPVRWY
jgi:formylglycine-generating enzyme required for sulfatase activity